MTTTTTTTIQPRVFRVLFPHSDWVINENTGLQENVQLVNGGLLKINDDSEPSFDAWARKVKPNDFTRLYFGNKDSGYVRDLSDFVKTIERAKRQPELVWFMEETLEEWEAN